jgi:hypothetical protein
MGAKKSRILCQFQMKEFLRKCNETNSALKTVFPGQRFLAQQVLLDYALKKCSC